ncbi:hypothetical protein DM02DRAFT_496264, partial [Periconia macrospinosa]
FQVMSLTDHNLRTREYKKRKDHRKTKFGCLTCRSKRVKCDESIPVCSRCRRNNRICTYEHAGTALYNQEELPPESNCLVSHLSNVTVIPFDVPSVPNGTPSIHLIKHAHTHWSTLFQMHHSENFISLFKSESLVRDAVLALAACHLRHAVPHVVQHRVAELFQQNLALQTYRKMLALPDSERTMSNIYAIALGATMLNMLTFTLAPDETVEAEKGNLHSSWVFSDDKNRLGWLIMQSVLPSLFAAMMPRIEQLLTFLSPMFFGNENFYLFTDRPNAFEKIPKTWVRMFEVKEEGPNLIVLAHLNELGPDPSQAFLCLQFLSKVNPDIQQLMYNRDEKALWLFGYWLGMLCQFKSVWWFRTRAMRDYKAIRLYLRRLDLPSRSGWQGECWAEMMDQFEK